jgi:hypothetical protein
MEPIVKIKSCKRAFDAIIIERSSHKVIQNMCKDKGYDFLDIRKLVDDYGYTAHFWAWNQYLANRLSILEVRFREVGIDSRYYISIDDGKIMNLGFAKIDNKALKAKNI